MKNTRELYEERAGEEKVRREQLEALEATIAAAPDHELAPAALMAAIRCPALYWKHRQDAAKELIKYQRPTMVIHGDFADQLERAIERSNGHPSKLIEGSPKVLEHDPSELRIPMKQLATPIRRRA